MVKRLPHFLLLIVLLTAPVWLTAQRVTLSGTVRDQASGESLMGAYIILTDTTRPQEKLGCITNQAGFYSISVPKGDYRLTASFLSYQTLQTDINLQQNKTFNIELVPNAIAGEEVFLIS